MKKLNYLIILTALITVSSCKFEKRNETNTETVSVVFEISEFIGQWAQAKNENELNNPTIEKIRKINFKKNKSVEIEVLDSIDYKTFTGTWEIAPIMGNIQMAPIPVIKIDYLKNEKDNTQVLLTIEKNNLKTVLKSDNIIFEKQ